MQETDSIFGVRPVIEAIEGGKVIDKLFIQKGLRGENIGHLQALAKEYDIMTQYVPIEKMDRLTRKNHQGVFAFISPIDFYSIENLLPQIFESGKVPLILILDKITDVRNFGAIARTAECVGVNAILIPQQHTAPINADAIKTSTGALFKIPVCKEKNLKEAINYLKLSGIQVVCATEKADDLLYKADFLLPTAIIMGSEDDGVSGEFLRMADKKIKLPMLGTIASLNVSVACGAILYEAVRQRINANTL